ncbi:hypothetical protein V8G54_001130 [Vigna mungo]|uniref:Uncharacterized protein n=1 Tax=Vigna mungo TaxID=3915 RepID=A0AAQ3P5V6_VIGMU
MKLPIKSSDDDPRPKGHNSTTENPDGNNASNNLLNIRANESEFGHDPKHYPGPRRVLFPAEFSEVLPGGDAEAGGEELDQEAHGCCPHQKPQQGVAGNSSGLKVSLEVARVQKRYAPIASSRRKEALSPNCPRYRTRRFPRPRSSPRIRRLFLTAPLLPERSPATMAALPCSQTWRLNLISAATRDVGDFLRELGPWWECVQPAYGIHLCVRVPPPSTQRATTMVVENYWIHVPSHWQLPTYCTST